MTNTKRYILLALLVAVSLWSRAEGLTLDSCLQLARQNNLQIREAQLTAEQARLVREQARTKYFPQISAMAGAYHALHPVLEVGIDDLENASVRDLLTMLYGQYGDALGLPNTLSFLQNGYMLGVTAIQPVFMGGKIVAGNRLAAVGVEAAALQQQLSERDVLNEVEQSYWLVVGLRDKQRTLQSARLLLDTIHTTVSVAVGAGLALQSDLLQVEIRQAELQQKDFQLQSGLRLATRALCQAIGITYSQDILLISTPDDTELQRADIASPATTESQLLGLQVRAAQLEKRMVLADALPQVAVGANYGYSHLQANILRDGLGGKTGNGALFLTVKVPLTGWWETGYKLKEKQLAIDKAKMEEQRLGELLTLRQQQQTDALNQSVMMVETCQQLQTKAADNYRITEVNYRNGRATIQELLTSQMQLLDAENQLTDAFITYRINKRLASL